MVNAIDPTETSIGKGRYVFTIKSRSYLVVFIHRSSHKYLTTKQVDLEA